ncbi:hypothetical protein ZOD2009_18305 [Haladaptatus paucihalophilus DX253]|uniref:Uncharacterized protein n=1 Tax=Haladaptatus paucihalophilus DX253 TaxID=797209 RepID=E7QXX2_HALPU|nr:hypothetical protein [Haladaptatus paucihalophilus]EFW90673.1 hypothetical protein ZOD2009_18305 [Haladaptatus paucihalophilus DX253]SHL55817.1 hypothetical protein SAMN05444342_4098 [Haladaptatus paucihalophilus DX253]
MSTPKDNADENDVQSRKFGRRRLLTAGAGVAVTAVEVPSLSSTAVAHFPQKLDIDVKPDSESNEIDLDSRGVVPVAVRQTDAFDPTGEAVRYRFGAPDAVADGGGACLIHDGHVEDVDGDGSDELVLHFSVADVEFDADETEAELRWERDESGEHGFSGRDSVQIVGRGDEHSGEDDPMDGSGNGSEHDSGGEHEQGGDGQHQHGSMEKDGDRC